MARARQTKLLVRKLLDTGDLPAAAQELRGQPFVFAASALIGELKSIELLRKHHAARLLGLLVEGRVEDNGAQGLEQGREMMRRLVWSLNEESGGIGWGAPEGMSEILWATPKLAPEFTGLLVSYVDPGCHLHLDHAALLAGACWALGRLGPRQPDLLNQYCAGPALLAHLTHLDPLVRGVAAWALGNLAWPEAAAQLKKLSNDREWVSYYDQGRVVESQIRVIAGEALNPDSTS